MTTVPSSQICPPFLSSCQAEAMWIFQLHHLLQLQLQLLAVPPATNALASPSGCLCPALQIISPFPSRVGVRWHKQDNLLFPKAIFPFHLPWFPCNIPLPFFPLEISALPLFSADEAWGLPPLRHLPSEERLRSPDLLSPQKSWPWERLIAAPRGLWGGCWGDGARWCTAIRAGMMQV